MCVGVGVWVCGCGCVCVGACMRAWVGRDGTEEKRFLYLLDEEIVDVSLNFPKFEEPFRYYGIIEDGFIGNAKTQLCSARKMYEVMEKIYKNNCFGELLHNDLPIDKKLYV